MKAGDDVRVRDVRRGAELDSIEFTLTDDSVLIAHAHGIGDEKGRVRERLFKVLSVSLAVESPK